MRSDVGEVVAEGPVELALSDGSRVFATRLEGDGAGRSARLVGPDVMVIRGNLVLDQLAEVNVPEMPARLGARGPGRASGFRDEVLPYYAGDDLAARDLAANDFKYWELMRRSCARGLKVFDYGRSKQGTGPYAFKKNWGFEPQPLHYEYCLYKRDAVPQNNPSNPKYQLMIKTWRRLPIGVANWLGPFIVRSLG
jgi:hypothetical protein